jgi:hypothetical protein
VPPAARELFEKSPLDPQKLFITKNKRTPWNVNKLAILNNATAPMNPVPGKASAANASSITAGPGNCPHVSFPLKPNEPMTAPSKNSSPNKESERVGPHARKDCPNSPIIKK